uniref:Uncharacterized protein n=1 Tax=Pseudothermotoga hypogea TaxID=57487 RepID=A0A832MM67_9THEM
MLNFVEENVPDEELVAHVAKEFKTTVGFAEVLIAMAKYKPEMYPRVIQVITDFQESYKQRNSQLNQLTQAATILQRLGYDKKTVENITCALRRSKSPWAKKKFFERATERIENASLLTDEDWQQIDNFRERLIQKGYSKYSVTENTASQALLLQGDG